MGGYRGMSGYWNKYGIFPSDMTLFMKHFTYMTSYGLCPALCFNLVIDICHINNLDQI